MPDQDDHLTTATHEDGQPAKRKRLRIPKSCIPCLKGKRACDRGRPACGRCARSGQSNDCSYDPRLPQEQPTPVSSSSKRSNVYDDSDDDEPDTSVQDNNRQLAALQRELEEARSETRRLQHLLRTQQTSVAPASPRNHLSPQYRSHPYTTPHWSQDRHRATTHSSSANDLHAARGLQMLAEIAGPQHQDADSNAVKSRILHWSGPASHASSSSPSSSSQLSPVHRSISTSSRDSLRPHDSVASPLTAESRNTIHFQRQSSTISKPTSSSETQDLESPRNINGTHMYFGPTTSSGDKVLATFPPSTSVPSHASSTATIESLARRDMQSAFNSVLDPSRDTFPFATIWSSGTAFIDEVLPFFPKPDDFDSICASFVRHFSAMCPALTIPTAIDYAKTFSRMSREQKGKVSLPWLAVFLMICALGKNCDLEGSASVGVDRKVRMLGKFLSTGENASRAASRDGSPSPIDGVNANGAAGGGFGGEAKSPAMVSDLFLSAAYQSLRLCSFLSAPTLQTIHSQLLIGAYLLNTERAASFWPLLGSVARQAQSIGLHVDPYKIKRDWDPVEADTRRRLWWAVVHQDVILSSIFGRPLGITKFSCRFPESSGGGSGGNDVTYARLQCEFSQFARTYLDENQDRSWSQEKVMEFTEQVLEWYGKINERYRLGDLGRFEILKKKREGDAAEGEGDKEAVMNYKAAGVDVKTKGLMEVHQSGNLAVEVFYNLLSIHRSNLFPTNSNLDQGEESNSKDRRSTTSSQPELNGTSLHICTQALRRITRAQTTMIDLLGRARATMFWKIAYYTYQAAIAGAYIVFLKPQSEHAESALEDLAILTDFFDRMPERWTGLKMAKHGLRVLRKLAVAAKEVPGAASMSVRGQQEESGQNEESLMVEGGGVGDGVGATGVNDGGGGMTPAMISQPNLGTTSSAVVGGIGGASNGDTSSNSFYDKSTFLPPIFGSSFLSPASSSTLHHHHQSMITNSPLSASTATNSSNYNMSSQSVAPPAAAAGGGGERGFPIEPTTLFTSALTNATTTGSPLSKSLTTIPLVTLFNNTYDQHESSSSVQQASAVGKQFCYDPFIPDPDFNNSQSPETSNTSYTNTKGEGEREGLNQKDLANYWSEYFSLQLDWDRLTGLA